MVEGWSGLQLNVSLEDAIGVIEIKASHILISENNNRSKIGDVTNYGYTH